GRPIGTKWVLKNKKDERGIIIINKARLVAQRHIKEEGIDYDELFAPVARIEAIRLFLAYASFMGFTVYQMDVKSSFLYGTINEEVGTIDQNLFIRRQRGDFILVQVYVDDIIFGSSNPHLYREFEALMHEKFQMSAMGELNFFLGLQVLQKEDGIFLSQDKYVGDILKKFGYSYVRSSNTPMDKENPWGKDSTEKDVDLYLYRSMIGSLMYLTASRPDIMFAICACARHQVTPKEFTILEKSEHNVDFHPIVDFVEASPLRRNLKLQDQEGISSLPDTELFETLTLMGYNISPQQKFTFQKGSGTPTEPHHIPSQEAQPSSHTHISSPSIPTVTSVPTIPISSVIPSETTPIKQYTQRVRIAQSYALPPIADEPASPVRDDTPSVTSHAAEEGSMQQSINELTALCTSLLKERVTQLEEREGVATTNYRDDAPIKGRSMDEEEAATERVSDDTEEMATVLTSMDATTVLASGVVDVPNGSGSIPTASTPAEGSVPTGSEEVPTASPVFATATVVTPVARRKGKEVMVESETPKKKKVQEQIDAQVARELKVQLSLQTNGRFYSYGFKEEAEKIKRKEGQRNYWKITRLGGSSACYQFFIDLLKHLDREDLNQLWRLVKETLSTRPPTSDKEMELWVELNRLYEPDEEDQLWTHTQNFMHAPVDWKLYDSCGVHHVAAKDKKIFMLVEKNYPLRKGLALVMICYKL
nr:hypothetical protein [Tanacetum cinerariifolium]